MLRFIRHVVVFDAADIDAESSFWAGMFDGRVFADDRFHAVVDAAASGSSASNSLPITCHPIGPTGMPSRCLSISTSTITGRPTHERWRSVHGCCIHAT